MLRTLGALDEPPATRALQRGLAVIEALAEGDDAGLGLTALGQRIDLDKATVARLLRTLAASGYVIQDPVTRRYRLTGRILWLAHAITARLDLRTVARPHLVALRDELGETVHLGVLEGLQVVYVDKLDAENSIQLVSGVGQAMPLHSTALGKALLAALPCEERELIYPQMDFAPRTERTIRDIATFRDDIRRTEQRGYATDDRENEPLGACCGAAILNAEGRPIGAVSISGPYFRIDDRLEYFGERARAVAAAISRELGADPAASSRGTGFEAM